MSRQVVGNVITYLLTDEDLRERFATNPLETIVDLTCQGFELTAAEIDVFVRTDARLWCWSPALVGHRRH